MVLCLWFQWLGAQGENPRDAYVMDLHNRGLTHITSLEQCTRLRSLDLSFNKLTSLAGLSSLRDLRELKLYGNSIQYISGLERCVTQYLGPKNTHDMALTDR
eukprot:jgi/Chlat1/2404/Chrsp17S02662